ncbi:hypothetical protein OE88DRAFT_1627519 [Heliocybe sulcata]|uniref:Uncharacterized protein n=1 Tax=Heliocybe sulcata TaxID=5364 RepID=A0A5C3N7C0_9AGAM|nr:hypothetical protein OE88DRAFT_1627519 [Heliocybe sulcata]
MPCDNAIGSPYPEVPATADDDATDEPSHGASTEDNEEDSRPGSRFVEPFPGAAGDVLRQEKTKFNIIREVQEHEGEIDWSPFEDKEEWELASWLVQNVGQNQMDEFLKLPITRNRMRPSYKNRQSLNAKIDALPTVGAKWTQEVITIAGTEFDENGKLMDEEVELWFRDPVECIRELIGNPAFNNKLAYVPERVYADSKGAKRIYDEMWTADWWWDMQSKLPCGATVAPVILASDKTQLSQHRGDEEAWPVYLTIGNIEKGTRRSPSSHAMVLVGYLPIAELSCVSENNRAAVGYRLFHFCMRRILASLIKAGSEGVEMVCADRWVRLVFPILAAYVADHPECCLIACCKQNRCLQCLVDPKELGDLLDCIQYRKPQRTKKILEHKATGRRVQAFSAEGLRPVDKPFWADLPHTDIFRCFMPDLLHQVHKGVIKDHLLSWCVSIAGAEEVDAQFSCMPDHPDIRHFKNGISGISQWTGTESRELEKVLVGILNGAVQPSVAKAARALLDFSFYAQLHTHTDDTLTLLQAALHEFHEYKDIFLKYGVRDDFNFPKLHAIQHYLDSIKSHGSADGYNTELPECLHIDFAKAAYHATNKRDYTEQMTRWLDRQEWVHEFSIYLDWRATVRGPHFEDCYSSEETMPDQDDEDSCRPSQSVSDRNHRLILPCQPSFPQTRVATIVKDFSAPQFLEALTEYLRKSNPLNRRILEPNIADRFDIYKHVKIQLPCVLPLDTQLVDRIRASPPTLGRPGRKGVPSHSDTVLVSRDGTSVNTMDIKDLLVAQVRVIFTLPIHLRVAPQQAQQLAYVEWFTPPRATDHHLGLLSKSRWEVFPDAHLPHAEVIPLDRIVRSCHLFPKFGTGVPDSWRVDNVLEQSKGFYLNVWVDLFMFCLARLTWQ